MGNSLPTSSPSPTLPSKSFDFEVLQVSSSSRQWSSMQLVYSSKKLIAFHSKSDTEELPINADFKIINEDPESCILSLQFYSFKASSIKTWKIRPKDPSDYISWKETLQDLLKSKWLDSKKCEICKTRFNIIKRKHHCRKCFKCICADCSPFRTTLPELGFQEMVRICRNCSRSVCEQRKGESRAETPNFIVMNK